MKKVLLVEDNPSMRDLLKILLELEGFEVLTGEVADAGWVIAALGEGDPDIVFMDVNQAGSNGLEILKQIRLVNQEHPVRVLMTSGEDLTEKCIAAGADGFLMKPYMPDQLIDWLKQVDL